MEAYRENAVLKSTAWQGLMGFMREHHQTWDQSVPDFEQFEREFLATELAHYDVQVEQVLVHGVVYGQPMPSTETYLTTAGPVTVERQLYRPAGRGSRHQAGPGPGPRGQLLGRRMHIQSRGRGRGRKIHAAHPGARVGSALA